MDKWGTNQLPEKKNYTRDSLLLGPWGVLTLTRASVRLVHTAISSLVLMSG